jgi:hypothetical protein
LHTGNTACMSTTLHWRGEKVKDLNPVIALCESSGRALTHWGKTLTRLIQGIGSLTVVLDRFITDHAGKRFQEIQIQARSDMQSSGANRGKSPDLCIEPRGA